MLKKWLRSDAALLIWRLALVYLVLTVCRLIFWLYNYSLIGPVALAEMPALLRGALVFDTATVLYTNGLFILLSLLPLRSRSRRPYRSVLFILYMVVNGLTVAINLADCVYFRYTQKRFTADEVFFAGNDNSLSLIVRFAVENWYLVAAALLLFAVLWFGYRRRAVPSTPLSNPWIYYPVNTLILASAAVLAVGGIRGGFSRTTRPITLSNATQWAATPQQANLILSNPFAILRTAGNQRITYTKYFPEDELEVIFTPYHYPADTSAIDLGRRNVVIFVMESFSAEHSALLNPHLYPDGEGFTPFLDSLMRTGYAFTYAIANGHKSIEALPSVLGSIPSFKKPFVLLPQSVAETRQLPRTLADEGYTTVFFCGSPRGSMGFGAYARSAGIQTLYGQEDYEAVHGKGDFDGYWGIWDEPFLQYMGEELGRLPQPFLATVFTLSSHHPFVVPDKYRDILPAGKTKIHKGVAYTDRSIRAFFERFSGEPWFRNTIFVFVADHVSSEKFAPETYTELGSSRIIQFLYTPDGSLRGRDATVTQQADLMPTLLGLVGYRKPYFAFGRDVFNEPDRLPFAYNYSTRGLSFLGVGNENWMLFDGEQVRGAWARQDPLAEHDIYDPNDPCLRLEERFLKAVIQQYYSHLEERRYTVPE